jgi:Recombination directionality factor-like
MARSNVHPLITLNGTAVHAPTVLGGASARIPTGGKIRAGIKVLTRRAAEQPLAREIYDDGVAAGQSFEEIERSLARALPDLKTPLVPRNVPWFTVREQDFPNPAIARQIVATFGEDRGEGRRVYRFPVVFPSDCWQTVMPHELAAWGAHEKRYWSEYSADGRVRHCKCHAPVPLDDTGKRTIRLFGGRKTMLREANQGLCEPEGCAEYQHRQCNLSGRFLFFIPGIRSISAFELHTHSFYAMNAAIQRFETVGFLRGERISGFLDRQRTPFYLSKQLMEVAHIDEAGRAVRVPQWIIELEAPVDVAALLRDGEDDEAAIEQARFASQVLGGEVDTTLEAAQGPATPDLAGQGATTALQAMRIGEPSPDKVLAAAQAFGIEAGRYEHYAALRWGPGWKLNPQGRRRAWDELDRYRNDPAGYCDKIDSELSRLPRGVAP